MAFLSRFPFISTFAIDSPPGARELTRRHPAVKVDVPGTDNDPLIVSAHLKAGTLLVDRFRRAVEMRRLTGYLTFSGLTDDNNFIVLGDFNPSSINATFNELPAGLPGTYVLGNDITFPVTYSVDPLVYFSTPGAVKAAAFQLNGSTSTFNTLSPGGPELDLILVSPAITARPLYTEIYNSALDLTNNDGQSDEYEIAFGSDPLDPESRFEPQFTRTEEGLQLSFPGAAGIAYTVEFSETLDDWHDFTTITGEGETIIVPLPMLEPTMFFRLKAPVIEP